MIRKAMLAAALVAGTSGPVFAGGMAEPLMEPEVLVEETAAGSGGIVIPLVLLAIIAAVATSSGGGSGAGPTF